MLTHGAYSGIFITGIFGNFYTERGDFLTSRMGIAGGPDVELIKLELTGAVNKLKT